MKQSHVWKETDEEMICIKIVTMSFAHHHPIARFATGFLGLLRDPLAVLEVMPLRLTLASGGLKLECRFDLQSQTLTP